MGKVEVVQGGEVVDVEEVMGNREVEVKEEVDHEVALEEEEQDQKDLKLVHQEVGLSLLVCVILSRSERIMEYGADLYSC